MLRVSETVAIKVGDIKADRKCLHIPSGKGGAERMAEATLAGTLGSSEFVAPISRP